MIFPRARRREDNTPASLARARARVIARLRRLRARPKLAIFPRRRHRYVNRLAFNDLRARVIQDLTKIRGRFSAAARRSFSPTGARFANRGGRRALSYT